MGLASTSRGDVRAVKSESDWAMGMMMTCTYLVVVIYCQLWRKMDFL